MDHRICTAVISSARTELTRIRVRYIHGNNLNSLQIEIRQQYCRPNKMPTLSRKYNADSVAGLPATVCQRGLRRSGPRRSTGISNASDLRKWVPPRFDDPSAITKRLSHRYCAPILKKSKSRVPATSQWPSDVAQSSFAQLRLADMGASSPATTGKLLTETKRSAPAAPANGLDRFWR